jgi:Flp pilus assembly protein TadB
MAKAKRRSNEVSSRGPRTTQPLYIGLIILGLVVTLVAFVLVPPSVRVICLATAAFLVWQLLRVIGWL